MLKFWKFAVGRKIWKFFAKETVNKHNDCQLKNMNEEQVAKLRKAELGARSTEDLLKLQDDFVQVFHFKLFLFSPFYEETPN